eukprot:TRINITY_DN10718_c0_g2_i4.p1 TRINITY_DN10718_c0_g2~~TRINITY_DN10718_c0_g2_i4.p1  ORF type:complete len:236 (-),score=44.65 TRINITY_DN10718_c0_g2_i4:28-735(-)
MKIRFEEERNDKNIIEWKLYSQKKTNPIGEEDIEKEMSGLRSCGKILKRLVNHETIKADIIENIENYIEKDMTDKLWEYNYSLTENKKNAKVPICCARCVCFIPTFVHKCTSQHFLCSDCYSPSSSTTVCPMKSCKGRVVVDIEKPVNKVEPICFECQSNEYMETHWDKARGGEKCLLAACRNHRGEFGDLVANNYGKCPKCESDLTGCLQCFAISVWLEYVRGCLLYTSDAADE